MESAEFDDDDDDDNVDETVTQEELGLSHNISFIPIGVDVDATTPSSIS